MTTTVRYFASVREWLGCSTETVELPPELLTVGQARVWLAARSARHADALGPQRGLRVARDQMMADDSTLLAGCRELAFFPPVTGG